jgi:hypothetical protein
MLLKAGVEGNSYAAGIIIISGSEEVLFVNICYVLINEEGII